MVADSECISIEAAEALVTSAFEAVGAPEANAKSVAAALVAAEAEGQVGHGFSRIADYAAQAKSGKVKADARPRHKATGLSALSVDAGNGFAYPALDAAIDWGIQTAQEHGCASMGISRSHHCGALSVQVDKIAQAGLIGIMVANSPPAMAPWGAHKGIFGTNPIAFSAPRADQPPLVIDLSLSRVARGKVMHAKKTGAEIPEGWALGPDGEPTTDPETALSGTMLPIGDAKGTALALMVEVLAACLAGANLSQDVSSFFTSDGPPPGAGQFLMALRPGDAGDFGVRLEALLGSIEALDGARLPGTRRIEALAQAKADGIRVPVAYLETARALAAG